MVLFQSIDPTPRQLRCYLVCGDVASLVSAQGGNPCRVQMNVAVDLQCFCWLVEDGFETSLKQGSDSTVFSIEPYAVATRRAEDRSPLGPAMQNMIPCSWEVHSGWASHENNDAVALKITQGKCVVNSKKHRFLIGICICIDATPIPYLYLFCQQSKSEVTRYFLRESQVNPEHAIRLKQTGGFQFAGINHGKSQLVHEEDD
jgi:hypothetical protein